MAKFFGSIGFALTEEAKPGKWKDAFTERRYSGNVLASARKLEQGTGVNDDVVLNNRISIVADPYADAHFFAIRYVRWMGGLWKVVNVEIQRPRLILTIGGVYNGPVGEAP